MDPAGAADVEANAEAAPGRRRSRRPVVAGIVLAVLVVAVLAAGAWWVVGAQPEIAYDGPAEAVAPGGTVVVPAGADECGPLFTSLHRKGRLGLWSQTHSGDVFNGFHPDERPWWRLRGGTYMTPVPCSIDGTTTFSLPADIEPGTVAACDSSHRCAELRVG